MTITETSDRPPGVQRIRKSGREYFYFRAPGSRRVSLGTDEVAAYSLAREMIANGVPPPVSLDRNETIYRARLVDIFDRIEDRIKYRAKQRGWEAAITRDDIIAMVAKQDGRCALTGLKFDVAPLAKDRLMHVGALRPSIDRKDASKGYTADNCRLVCHAVNIALGQWGDEVYLKLAKAAIRHASTRRSSA